MEVTEIENEIARIEEEIHSLLSSDFPCEPDDMDYISVMFEVNFNYLEMSWMIENTYMGA